MVETKQKSSVEIEQTEEEAKNAIEQQKASREVRSLKLIADFEEGFSKDWVFPIPDAYKNELDIKYIQRMEPAFDEKGKPVMVEVKDKKGNVKLNKDDSPVLKQKSRPVMRWTQGRFYCFAEGHVIYGPSKTYEGKLKDDLVNYPKFRIEILRATPSDLDSNKQFQDGWVTFMISESNNGGINYSKKIGQYSVTQTDFVDFLKNGRLKVNFDYLLELIRGQKS